jgi:hypothetical protein
LGKADTDTETDTEAETPETETVSDPRVQKIQHASYRRHRQGPSHCPPPARPVSNVCPVSGVQSRTPPYHQRPLDHNAFRSHINDGRDSPAGCLATNKFSSGISRKSSRKPATQEASVSVSEMRKGWFTRDLEDRNFQTAPFCRRMETSVTLLYILES